MKALWRLHESIEKAFWYTLTRKLFSFLLLFCFTLGLLVVYVEQKNDVMAILTTGGVDRALVARVQSGLENGLVWMGIITLMALVVNIAQILYMRWLIVRPLKVITGNLNAVSNGEGDFTCRLPLLTHDELRDVSAAYNLFAEKMSAIVQDIQSSTSQVLRSADDLTGLSSRYATNSQQQSRDAYDMAAQVEILTYTLDSLADQSANVQLISGESSDHSTRGGEVIHAAANEMHQIAQSVNESSQIIQDLGRQSDQISQIVNVIKEIADQTNLLALNAAIEAARAGEQGRGFAVVADEVRKLAERTSNSTQEITAMIEKIQSGTRLAIQSMDAGVKRVGEGALLAQQAGEAINQIKSGIGQVVSAVNEISTSLKEQAASNAQNAHKVEAIARVSEENGGAFLEMAGTAQQLDELAKNLGGLVGRFKV